MKRRIEHKYLSIFSGLIAKLLVSARPARESSVLNTFAPELLQRNSHSKVIQRFAIDMSAAYTRDVSDNFSTARVVYDKLYIIKYVV